jgi:ComF family protein
MTEYSCTPRTIRRIAGRIADALLPRHCILCGLISGTKNLCIPCRDDLPRNRGVCLQCALPLPGGEGQICGSCLARPPPWDYAIAALHYGFPVDRLVCRFKFNRNLACGAVLSDELLISVEEQCKALPGLIVPVPLHRGRQFRRNFNQADILARTIGKGIDVPVSSLFLNRRYRTHAQSGLDAKARRKNTRGAFSLGRAAKRHDVQHVALVDDVMTTGATLYECSRILKKAGVKTVSAWVAARAPAV